ncbi:DUF2185 domain-containing protein [Myroides marinus]|uniref:DUF2185 domain-containing protein n=1 Tax=Myroides marinus TaxID=703342 RepID=UPI0025772B9F|nr:DUF2185 domain-containing protein [Myroides marinus]MDM1361397.1 DUF2185 domain-containing protein [Myroides marinus]MDM1405979.1 DUF2185 domain-containing protein [Myroides marinus]MDM1502803.1 DUF2185 domain-containing protein [Myroides marinus]
MNQNNNNNIPAEKNLVEDIGFCLASGKIMILGEKVDYMYREEPNSDTDSGWRFLSNTEDEEYLDNPENSEIYSVNAVAHNDMAIIPYLKSPVGSELVRVEGTDEFKALD